MEAKLEVIEIPQGGYKGLAVRLIPRSMTPEELARELAGNGHHTAIDGPSVLVLPPLWQQVGERASEFLEESTRSVREQLTQPWTAGKAWKEVEETIAVLGDYPETCVRTLEEKARAALHRFAPVRER